ncbi:MAG: apolipoprotein acyltransferase [Cyclobacteriaceae bacterium]|nr:MAG: apolipoprotein acyltransferase [Cyclobacteriaceae bacterium]
MIAIGIIQETAAPDPAINLTNTEAAIRGAAREGAQIICLQELFQHQYFCQTEDYEKFNLAQAVPGIGTAFFQELSEELAVVIIASLFEERTPGIYHNTVAVIDADGSYLGKYRKMHIPDDPGFYEKFYFTPGDLGYKVFDTRYAKVGTLICWDQWFPEAARLTAMKGADILFYPTAIGWDLGQDQKTNTEQFEAWQTIQRAHAIANGVHVVAVNRVGIEGNIKFWGGSMVVNPFGGLLHQADDQPCVQVTKIDLKQTNFYRSHWPFFRDRRIDSYQNLEQRFSDEG